MLPFNIMMADHVTFFPALLQSARVVCRFQDSKDKASTANLKHHALCCFGEDAVNGAIMGKEATNCNGSIFALFAHQGKKIMKYLHHVHTNTEVW